MTTEDVLLDMQFSIGGAKREPTVGNVMQPDYLVIKGVKFTVVMHLEIDTNIDSPWDNYFTKVKKLYVFDPDNFKVTGLNMELMNGWAAQHILLKDVNDFTRAYYNDEQDWALNSTLVELEIIKP